MQVLRFIIILFLLVSSGNSTFAFPFEMHPDSLEIKTGSQVSQDFQDLMPSRISFTPNYLNERLVHGFSAILVKEDRRDYSRSKMYIAQSRFIIPGLSIPNLIFPFHTFL